MIRRQIAGVVGIEIQDASKRPGNPLAVEYAVAV
jgi:hypothetical protein